MTPTLPSDTPLTPAPHAICWLPHDLAALLVEVALGAAVWAVALSALALTSPRIPLDLAWAFAACGVVVGAAAALIGWIVGRRHRWWLILDLPLGGAIVTSLLLAVFGAAFGWHLPLNLGAGRGGQILQAGLCGLLAGAFGTALGALLGLVAELPANGLLRLFYERKDPRREGA